MTTMAEFTRLTLANIALDLQITICILLHPTDILALRKTCKALELSTRKRVVWLAALHRVCLDNTLFLPSFPIPDMSDLELEQAAIAPHRWIRLCGALKAQDSADPGEILYPRTTRIIMPVDLTMQPKPYIFLVPGGRYLVIVESNLSVWDLGYVPNAHCTLIASVGLESGSQGDHDEAFKLFCMVQATPDDMGLIIFVSAKAYHSNRYITIYEIYPQSESPLLTQIAQPDFDITKWNPIHLLTDTLVFHGLHGGILFRFWDYRVNCSTFLLADVDVIKFETFVTKTAFIVFCEEGILIWAIPPLLPHSPDLFLDENPRPRRLPPLFKIPFPTNIVHYDIYRWKTVSSWYFRSQESVYYLDSLRRNLKLDRFKLVLKPDLSEASFHVINSFEPRVTHRRDYTLKENISHYSSFYRVCEGAPFSFWCTGYKCGVDTGFTSADFPDNIIAANDSRWISKYSHSLCPASGRFVYCPYGKLDDARLVVVDLF